MVEMKESNIKWIGKIPMTWNLKKIKYLLGNRTENNNPIKSRDILSLTAKQGVIPLAEKEGGGNKPKEDYSAYRLAYPNDIVMNSMNILSGSVGLSKYFGCVSPVYYMLYTLFKDDDIRFYHYIFQTTVFQKSLLGLGNGILIKESENGKLNTIRMRIPIDKLGNLYIPITSSEQQRKIADFLDEKCAEIDSISAEIQEQINTLEEYKKSVITEAVTKGLNPNVEMKDSGIEWIGEIPNDWEVKKLKYFCDTRNEKYFPSMGQLDYLGLENIVSWHCKSIQSENEYDLEGSNLCYKNDVVFGKLRPYLAKVYLVDYNRCCSSEFAIFCNFNGSARFYKYLLVSHGFVNTVDNSTYGIKMPRANIEFIKNVYVPHPKAEEQEIIANFLDSMCIKIDSAIEDKQKQLKILDEYKKTLIYEYVTGKKEVA